MIVTTYVGFFMCTGFTFLFTGIIIGCCDRFNALNRRILMKFQPTSFEIRFCVELHQDLVRVIQKINLELTHPLILIFTYILIILTFNTFTTLKLFQQNFNENGFLIVMNATWSSMTSYLMIIVIHSSECARSEAQNFLEHGKQFLWVKKIYDDQLREDLKFVILSMNPKNLQLRTILFNLDWNLLLNVNLITFLMKKLIFNFS